MPMLGRVTSKRQFFHSSAESEIISLDAGVRIEELPANQFR